MDDRKNATLAEVDPLISRAIDDEARRQAEGLELIASENFVSEADRLCDRVAVIADQKVVAVGTIPELLALDHPWIQEYFHGPRGRAAAAAVPSRRARDAWPRPKRTGGKPPS